jgi:phosphatidylglycerophosphatase A
VLKDDPADKTVEKRGAKGVTDYIALALTTFGVGYIPGAPGTYGSAVGVAIYLWCRWLEMPATASGVGAGLSLNLIEVLISVFHSALNAVVLTSFCLVGIWASDRTAPIFGRKDPSQAVVDEVMGQLITYCFVPFGITWPFLLLGFLLFRLFDIIKPFPARAMESLPGGLGICADDIVAGVYAGVCLAVAHALYLFL